MKKIFYVLSLFTLALVGCQKDGLENQGMSDGAVKYAVMMNQSVGTKAADNGSVASGVVVTLKDRFGVVSIPMECEVTEGICCASANSESEATTKGTLVNTNGSDKALSEFAAAVGNKFAARAFEGSGSTPIITQDVEWKTDKWVGTPVAYWPQATMLTFLASANLPESEDVAKVSYASTGVTLDYKAVPEAASAQKDILLGHYQGNGGSTGTAEIHFEHPLTAVRFLRGDIDASISVKSISISGVAASGTATMDVSGAITWTEAGGYTHTVSQTDASGLNVDETIKLIGEPFIIIPQDLEGHNVTLTVILSTDSGDVTVTATINAGELKAGFTNTYTLGYSPFTNVFEVTENELVFDNTAESLVKSFKVKSYRYLGNEDPGEGHGRSAVTYSAEYSVDGKDDDAEDKVWYSFGEGTLGDELTGLTATGNAGSTGDSGMEVPLTAAARTNVEEIVSPYKWAEDTERGSAGSPLDLSRMTAGGEGDGTGVQNTANCYIVKHPGYYKFPCVYGNSIQNGVATDAGYHTEVTGDNILGTFLNSKGSPIKNGTPGEGAFILADITAAAPRASLLWCDAKEHGELLIQNVQLNGSGSGAYITFKTAPKADMVQGNAVIALYDGDMVLWSWHIWVTDADLGANNIGTVGGTYGEHQFMSRNIGWCDGRGLKYTASDKEIRIRLKQSTGEEGYRYVTVSQPDVNKGFRGNNTYFQWGRKDPFIGGANNVNANKTYYDAEGHAGTSLATNGFSEGNDCIASGIGKPATFCTNQHMDNKYCNLWSLDNNGYGDTYYSINVIKTIYDPSPYGYKVPNTNAFRNFTTTGQSSDTPSHWNGEWEYSDSKAGFTFKNKDGIIDNNLFFPASGYRYQTTGIIFSTAAEPGSDIWSAVPGSLTNGFNLLFASNRVNPLATQHRSGGYSIRPVLEADADVDPNNVKGGGIVDSYDNVDGGGLLW